MSLRFRTIFVVCGVLATLCFVAPVRSLAGQAQAEAQDPSMPPLPKGASTTPMRDLLGMSPRIEPQALPVVVGTGDPPLVQGASDSSDPDAMVAYDPTLSPEEIKAKARQEAFDSALEGMMPLRPEEITILLERYDEVQKTVEVPHYDRPKPVVSVETANLDPGAEPLSVMLAEGNVTTVTFLDVSGAPWPVEDMSWAGNFEVTESGTDDGTHILRITPQSAFAHGNMSVRLSDLTTPLVLTLATARDKVHYRFDVIVPQNGPMAKPSLIETRLGTQAGSVQISRVLEGVLPESFERLTVTGVDGRTSAYQDGSKGPTYLRTPLTLLSPGWSAHVSSADGMHVYVIEEAPVVLLSDGGRMVRAYLMPRPQEGETQIERIENKAEEIIAQGKGGDQ